MAQGLREELSRLLLDTHGKVDRPLAQELSLCRTARPLDELETLLQDCAETVRRPGFEFEPYQRRSHGCLARTMAGKEQVCGMHA